MDGWQISVPQSFEDVDPHGCGLTLIRQYIQQERHDTRIAEPLEVQQNVDLRSHR